MFYNMLRKALFVGKKKKEFDKKIELKKEDVFQ